MPTKAEALAELARRGKLPAPQMTPQASALVTAANSDALKARQMADMGNEFMGYNQSRGTGGFLTTLPSIGQPNKQAMEGITSAMLQASIVPGQSKSLDSNAEMAAALRRFPNVQSQGPVNRTRNIRLQQDKYVADQKLQAVQAWLKGGNDPSAFEADWGRRLPSVRAGFRYDFPAKLDAGKGEVGAVGGRVIGKVPQKAPSTPKAMTDAQIRAALGY